MLLLLVKNKPLAFHENIPIFHLGCVALTRVRHLAIKVATLGNICHDNTHAFNILVIRGMVPCVNTMQLYFFKLAHITVATPIVYCSYYCHARCHRKSLSYVSFHSI